MKNRSLALRTLLEKERLDGYIVTNPFSIHYFTSFMGGARLLVPKDDENILYVNEVNYESSKAIAKDCEVKLVRGSMDLIQKNIDDARNYNIRHLGFDTLDSSDYLNLKKRLKGVNLSAQGNLVWSLRKVKDKSEIQCLRKAAELADEGMKTAYEVLVPGLREYELAAEIEYTMRKLGSEGVAFDTIVASGTNSAFPHGGCTSRKIESGDFVMLDFGAIYKYYRTDMTRTVVMGKPSAEQVRIYEIVRKAQDKAFQKIQEGSRASDIDLSARNIIRDEGYGDKFVHGLGHGLGLEIHEPPTLNSESKEILKTGNVVTVEPGIYIANFGGVRVEDTVIVQNQKAEKLTKSPHDLIIS